MLKVKNLVCGGLLLLSSQVCLASEASHKAAAERLMNAFDMKQNIILMQDGMLQQMMQIQPCLKPVQSVVGDFYKDIFKWENFKDKIIDLYVKEISEKDLNEAAKFYETPAGKRILKKLPELTNQGAAIGIKLAQEKQEEFVKKIQDAYSKLDPKDIPEGCTPKDNASSARDTTKVLDKDNKAKL